MKLTTGKALLAGCIAMAMSQAAMAKDIKVAIVGAMSGPVAQYGDMEFTGARQAIADINAKGGIKGDKLVGVEYDDACDPKQAVAVANKVINDGIRYVIGHLCSSSTQPASDIYEDEGVIMITPAATNADLTTRGYKMILRTTGLDSDQGPTAAKYILSDIKPKRIAVVIRARWLDDDNKSTLQELADQYGVSAERVRQLEKNAMKKLKMAIEA